MAKLTVTISSLEIWPWRTHWKSKLNPKGSKLRTTVSFWINIHPRWRFGFKPSAHGVARMESGDGKRIVVAIPEGRVTGLKLGVGRCVKLLIFFGMFWRHSSRNLAANYFMSPGTHETSISI